MNRVKLFGFFQVDMDTSSTSNFFINPLLTYKTFWNYFILFLSFYTLFMIPLEIGMFILQQFEIYGAFQIYMCVEYFISSCLLFDVILNFFTAQFTPYGEIIVDKSTIMKNYLKGNFWIDLISIFPLDLIFDQNLNIVSYIYQILLKLPRFLRINKIVKMFITFETTSSRVFRMFFVYYLLCHYFACILCYTNVNVVSNYNVTKESVISFLSLRTSFTIYMQFFNLSLLVLVGNNLPPLDFSQRIIFVVMFYVGTLCDSIIFGSMAIIFTKVNSLEKGKNRRTDDITMLLDVLNMDKSNKGEILNYHDIIWWNDRDQFLSKDVLRDLNKILKSRINLHKCKSLLAISPYTENFSQDFLTHFTNKLKTIITYPNDIITFEGNIERKIFFIGKDGKFSVRVSGNIIKLLNEGDYFGEISFFLKSHRRIATVMSINISTLYYLENKALQKLFHDFPFEAREFYEVGFQRFKESYDFIDEDLKRKFFYYKSKGRKNYSNCKIWIDDILIMLKKLKK